MPLPSYSSSSPPITIRSTDDPRPARATQAPLPSPPSAPKTSPAPVSNKQIPIAKVDSGPPLGGKEPVANSHDEEVIDMEILEQIRDLDEDDELFSKDMVDAYFDQAEKAFTDMDAALEDNDLEKLSSLGHFLKGSSAALGVSRVRTSCEEIQNCGQSRNEGKDIKKDDAIKKITQTLARAREEYAEAKAWLDNYYASLPELEEQ